VIKGTDQKTRTIRALVLAAGEGKRLRPFTLHKPKCLMEVGGKPVLEHWLDKLADVGCERALVNTHYLYEQVDRFLNEKNTGDMKVESFYEGELMGTAGTLLDKIDYFRSMTGLLIHADNATTEELSGIIDAHTNASDDRLLTMMTFRSENPSSCGIVEVDSDGKVTGFHEKEADPPGDLANGAVYVFDDLLLSHLTSMRPVPTDFSIEVIPSLLGRIYHYPTKESFIDIGTPQALLRAQELWGC